MGRGGSEKRAGPFGFAQGKQARPYGEQRRDGTGLNRLRKKSLSSLKSAVMLSLSALLAWRFLGLCQTVSFTTWIGRLPSVGASRFSRGEQFLQPDQIRCGGVYPELPIHPPPPAQFCFSQTRRTLHPPKYLFDQFPFPLADGKSRIFPLARQKPILA